MFQIETPEVLNGFLVLPEHVMMNIKNIGCIYHPRRQTRLKISSFVNLQGKIKRTDCNSVKMDYFTESQ
jgi:hypothetical protein